MKLTGRGALVTAIVLGSVTSFLAWKYLDEVGQNARPVETAPVVVAVATIPARTVVTANMLRVRQMPVEGRHPNAVREPSEVVGKVSRQELTPGEPILTTKLFLQREESGLAFLVPPNKRAVSVGFTEVIGSGGLIQPGDHVDVIGVFEVKPTPTPAAGSTVSQTFDATQTTYVATMVLQNVEILAMAQRLEGDDNRDTPRKLADQTGLAGRSGTNQAPRTPAQPEPAAKSATLAVSPEDSLKLALAEERGKIRLALRQPNDSTLPKLDELPIAAIINPPNH